MSLELELWRTLGSPTDLDAALVRASAQLGGALAHERLSLWALEPAQERVVCLAASHGEAPGVVRSPAAVEAALARFEGPRVSVVEADGALARALELTAGALVGALFLERPLGLLVVDGPRATDAPALSALLAPFASAIAHARREADLALLRDAAEADNRALLSRLSRHAIVETVVGEHGGLREVMQRVGQVAGTDAPVLLLGETGSGKEVVARAIHERSSRRAGPMVRVNCGAIAPELIDSELFGHERGSFTGAVGARRGWFERAHGGTLLLDEIGELPAAAQVRLLRVVQDGTLQRVGAERAIHVDVRIVAATHRDLHRMVERGAFREDLWYRLSVFPLRLPPLRERREDIPLLSQHFAARVGERLSGKPILPTAEELSLLIAYDWPGNVRELAAVIERAAILGQGKRLEVAAALGAGGPARPSAPPLALERPRSAPVTPGAPVTADEIATLDDAIRAHVERALATTRGVIEGPRGAAARLGVNPHTLRAKMRKLRIDWSRFRG
ncbi:MAG: sigma 54-interacting transcriptional regulator [Sandaracinaceae bacterium]|nr:sigma 54-interacting transcriptional regulator [Sandaracinaceae bacterium]